MSYEKVRSKSSQEYARAIWTWWRGKVYAGGPQMVEISRDGKRVYWTNSLYSTWDNQFYPDGVPGAEVMANANVNGGLELAKDYWVSFPDGYRPSQFHRRASTSSHSAEIMVATLKINGWNPIAAPEGIAYTRHIDAVPCTLSLDGNLIPVCVSRTFARANESLEEPSNSGRDVSKGWSESLVCAVLNVALPKLAGNDLDPIRGVSWIMTAHDSIANQREWLGQSALNGAQFSYCRQRDKHECSGDECPKLAAIHSSRVATEGSIDDHAGLHALVA